MASKNLTVLNAQTLSAIGESSGNSNKWLLGEIDRLGLLSGEAQMLTGPITSVTKLLGTNHVIILCHSDTENEAERLTGFIKWGKKDLFFYRKNGQVVQKSDTMCLLDFYVEADMQRHGVGFALFNAFLSEASVSPSQAAYDRPSPKLLAFMKKHFGFVCPDMQPNRFTIFEGFTL